MNTLRRTALRTAATGLLGTAGLLGAGGIVPANAAALPAAAPASAASPGLLPSATGGYVWVDCVTSPSCTPDSTWSYNTAGGVNQVSRSGVGRYTVRFPGVASRGGSAHVTAYGSAANCKPVSWAPSGSDELLQVACFSLRGAPKDNMFTALFSQPTGPGNTIAYAWADQPTAPSYLPHRDYQYNNQGGTISVRRTARGVYRVSVPNVDPFPTTVKVSPYGPDANACRVLRWVPAATNSRTQQISVKCTSPAGLPADSRFVVSLLNRMNLLGNNMHTAAAVWGNDPTAASYTPNSGYQFNHSNAAGAGSPAQITRLGPGRYEVELPQQGLPTSGGHVQVSSYGAGSNHCQVGQWYLAGTTTHVQVACTTRSGAPADAQFTMQFTSPQ